MVTSSFFQEDKGVSVLKRIEAVLFVASEGATATELAEAVGIDEKTVLAGLEALSVKYREGSHGIEVAFLGGAWHLCTVLDVADAVDSFREANERERIRLSKAALETLAVVAYNQPVTRSEIEDIRGVRCERVIETLLSHGLVRISGRKKSTGSPLLYRTTDSFLKVFGLGAISDLPTVSEIEELRSRREDYDGEAQ